MSNEKPVLVAIDLGENTDEVLRQADGLARAQSRPLLVCHVLPEVFHIHPLFPQLRLQEAFELPRIEESVAEAVERRVQAATGRAAADFTVVMASGSAHHGILEQAKALDIGTIVVGAHGSGLAHALGNVAKRVVRHASCDVLVARQSPAGGGVLTATDFSDASRQALARAGSEAKASGRPLTLVYALDFIPPGIAIPTVDVPMPSMSALQQVRGEMQKLLEDEARALGASPVFREGPAGVAICETAKESGAQLVVVGTHGRTGFGRLALGSVAEVVIEHAPCSVLVVR